MYKLKYGASIYKEVSYVCYIVVLWRFVSDLSMILWIKKNQELFLICSCLFLCLCRFEFPVNLVIFLILLLFCWYHHFYTLLGRIFFGKIHFIVIFVIIHKKIQIFFFELIFVWFYCSLCNKSNFGYGSFSNMI